MMKTGEKKLVYVASPYSVIGKIDESNEGFLEERWEQVNKFMAHCLDNWGDLYSFFGPISMGHRIHPYMNPKNQTFEFWVLGQDLPILQRCDELWVLMLDQWQNSRGVQREIYEAEKRNMQIRFWKPEERTVYLNKTNDYKTITAERRA